MAELLIEILSEEIPARMQTRAGEDFSRILSEKLSESALAAHSIRFFTTPRRISVVLKGIPLAQPTREDVRKGPRVGAPEKALEGFLNANNLSSVEECEIREVKGSEFYFVVRSIEGLPAQSVLPQLIAEAIHAIPWPKSMRWGDSERRYVRPLEQVAAVFDGALLDGSVDFGGSMGLKPFVSFTRGHRFMDEDDIIPLSDFTSYEQNLLQSHVILDPAARKLKIEQGLNTVAKTHGLKVKSDPGLLAEVNGLVEWPVVLSGSIDEEFMSVPTEVLTTSMRSHQKYFALETAEGNLAPKFAVVANIESNDGGKQIIAGNERVLRARLADARFFWDQDRKVTLASRLDGLDKVIFHAQLGTLADRVKRIRVLSQLLAPAIQGADLELVDQAAMLSKADLISGMVGEFPELQGVMGRYYAVEERLNSQVADAIRDHYAPQGPSDLCPTAPVSVAIALADKIDTLVGFFAIDEKPTGSRDPYALRRAALGVIRLVIDNRIHLPLRDLIRTAYQTYVKLPSGCVSADDTAESLLQFLIDRLNNHLRTDGMKYDHVAAVFAIGEEDDILRLVERTAALGEFLASEDGGNLLIAYTRAANISSIEAKKDNVNYDGTVDPSLFTQDEEKRLFDILLSTKPRVEEHLDRGHFQETMGELAKLRNPVDAFFEKVTVNSEQPETRSNRLNLLSNIVNTMSLVADFGKIQG
jgi:glycyl-tRNA synthetase beta chain